MSEAPLAVQRVQDAIDTWGQAEPEPAIDGLSVRYLGEGTLPLWRFNVRESNTEPVLRLNVETMGDAQLLKERTEAVAALLEEAGGKRDTAFRRG